VRAPFGALRRVGSKLGAGGIPRPSLQPRAATPRLAGQNTGTLVRAAASRRVVKGGAARTMLRPHHSKACTQARQTVADRRWPGLRVNSSRGEGRHQSTARTGATAAGQSPGRPCASGRCCLWAPPTARPHRSAGGKDAAMPLCLACNMKQACAGTACVAGVRRTAGRLPKAPSWQEDALQERVPRGARSRGNQAFVAGSAAQPGGRTCAMAAPKAAACSPLPSCAARGLLGCSSYGMLALLDTVLHL